jgi:purine catabolism regulator
MMKVRDLLGIPRLRLSVAAGGAGLDNPIRFAHTSELSDPTPWLSGGELLLTTGMALRASPPSQRAYVSRLAQAGLAGLGFGLGFGFEEVPPAARGAAEEEGFPVLEVPYRVPFIAITEAIAARLAEERLRDAQMSVDVHERLTAMLAEGGDPGDVLEALTSLADGWALLFDLKGEVLGSSGGSRRAAPEPGSVWTGLPPGLARSSGPATASEVSPQGTRLALAVWAGKRPEAVLVFGKGRRLEQRDRIVVRHAVTVLGLLLLSRRAVTEAERRIAGDVLCDAFAGRLTGGDLERRLELVGYPRHAALTVLVVEGVTERDGARLEELVREVDAALGSRAGEVRTAVLDGRVAAVVGHDDPQSLAEALAGELQRGLPPDGTAAELRVGVGTTVGAASVRDSYLAAQFALRAAPAGRRLAGPDDLGSYRFLLGAQSRPLLESFVGTVLGPLIARDERRSSELVDSVRAFIASSGRWERGAEGLGVHRHTLRYRIRQAEELLGRDLSSAEDRLEVWLALKALDVLEA